VVQADASIKDTLGAFIYRQDPSRFDDEGKPLRIRTGQLISVWLSAEKTCRPGQHSKQSNFSIIFYGNDTVEELKRRMDAGEELHLVDVREPHENEDSILGALYCLSG
jgi:hypothetical protein